MAYYLKKPINFDRLSCRSLFQMDFLTRMKDMNCVQYLGQTFILFLNIDACMTKKHFARQGYVRPFRSCALRLLFLGITIVIFTWNKQIVSIYGSSFHFFLSKTLMRIKYFIYFYFFKNKYGTKHCFYFSQFFVMITLSPFSVSHFLYHYLIWYII